MRLSPERAGLETGISESSVLMEAEVTQAGGVEKREGLEQNLRDIPQLWRRSLPQKLRHER